MTDGSGQVSPNEDEPRQTFEGIPFARPYSPQITPATNVTIARHYQDIMLTGASRRSVCFDLGLVLVALIAIDFLSQVLLVFATGIHAIPESIPQERTTRILLIPILPARAAWVAIVLAFLLVFRGQSLASMGLTVVRFGSNVFLGFLSVGVAYAVILPLGLIAQVLEPEVTRQLNENAKAIMNMVPRHSPSFFTIIAMVIGFYEELLFRGFFMTRLRRATNSWVWAVFVSSAIFVVPHLLDQTLVSLVPITILSVLFSVLTIWRKSIIPAIIGHWLFNLFSFLGLYYTAGDSWT